MGFLLRLKDGHGVGVGTDGGFSPLYTLKRCEVFDNIARCAIFVIAGTGVKRGIFGGLDGALQLSDCLECKRTGPPIMWMVWGNPLGVSCC